MRSSLDWRNSRPWIWVSTGAGELLGGYAYIWRGGGALQVGLNGTVLLVEERHVRYEVLDNVHVRERVDARFLGSVGGDAACEDC